MKYACLTLLCLMPAMLEAQADSLKSGERSPFLLGGRLHYGFIIPHSKDIAGVAGSHPRGFELNVQWLLAQEKHTRHSGVIAKRGFLFHYINYDHPDVLGYCLSLAPYIEPLIRPDRRLYGSIQMGVGVSYLSKRYDEKTNPTNLFFSTPISFLLITNAYLNFKINTRWDISLGFNYNHISNGGMKTPNKGMNFPTYNIGTAYNFSPVAITRAPKTHAWKQAKRHYYYAQAVGTIKTAEATPAIPEKKITWQLGAIGMAGWRIGRLSALAAGTEWIHDGWTRENLDRAGDPTSAWKGGVLFGHELITGKVRFTVHLGAYVLNPSRTTDPVYQRYGLFYRIGRHLQVGSTLKAHRHVADVFDMRLGWVW
ncbi:MAG: acyloxyacyl hydrolase [Saprospiraceae bacterium]|jgi:hypothetical protein|nr:acyloxyacyl hydrolase [Lewinellaceae bacterium]